LDDVAQVTDSVEDLRNRGYANGKTSVNVTVNRQPGANIIDTVDQIRAALPQIKAAIPHSIHRNITRDQTITIRASVRDIERSLGISVLLVVLVVLLFLRSGRTTLIPSVAVPVSLIATFGVMYLFGYGLDNLSLRALTVSSGFVVDDAIVVIENITRYLEQGMKPFAAALRGAREIGSTVFTMSLSLIAVFIPLLMMGGIVGRLFREFAVTMFGGDRYFHGCLTDHHADDVRAFAQGTRLARLDIPDQRTGLQLDRQSVRKHAGSCAAASRHHTRGSFCHHRTQRLPLHSRAEGIFSAVGQRGTERDRDRRSGHLIPIHGKRSVEDGEDRAARSSGGNGNRLHGRQRRQRQHYQPGALEH
jgi:hypothetical protein